uniref:ABC transporter domain-containing protein n=1 Tax=Auxenochlorella protothecoides TaxID=3075 RepID=A0A1D1ZRH2_AUXPR
MDQPAVELRDLTFTYPTIDGQPRPGDQPIVRQLSLQLPRGSCTLLLGANGAGKTTLLRVLAGKHMVDRAALQVMGEPPFHATHLTTSNRLSYIGGNWDQDVAFAGYSQPLRADISAGAMLENVRGVGAARRAMLLEVMDINPAWRMHLVSDGQRRRVQIAMGLLHPFEVGAPGRGAPLDGGVREQELASEQGVA